MLFDTSDYGVYEVTRNDTGDVVYVGCSWKGIKKRFGEHISMLKGSRHPNSGLQKLWNAKGLTFTHVIKCLPIKKLALAFEKAYGAQYDFKKLVNVNPLGKAGTHLTGENHWINKLSEEEYDNFIEKRSEQTTKNWEDPEYREMQIKSHKGKKQSEETIRKRSETTIKNGSQKGENNPMFGRTGENHPMYGKPGYWTGKKRSKESRNKQSESTTGENNSQAKLTERKVKVIKYLLLTLTYHGAVADIADLYNISHATISDIKKGNSWQSVKISVPFNKTRIDGRNGSCYGVTVI
jgi:hypothetical protein